MSDASDEGNVQVTGGSGRSLESVTLRSFLKLGAIVAFVLLAVVAGVGLYTSLGAVIDVWVSDRLQPVVRAAFNFVVLCVAAIGVAALLRRRRR